MANYYDEQVSHMLHLINYGMKNESKKAQYESVMNQKEGADGRVYGIVMEGTKYYIKSCPKGKENLTESFDYIGGFVNRKNCSYASYADAVKDMDMRLMSLNEDYGKRVPINEMKRSADFMDESMVEMQEDLARHRQILENIDAVYQGGKGKISDRNTGVPEAPKTQEFNTKVGDPFDDSAKYEENRDNKENAKDHEKQGDPFKDEAEYKENTDNIQKQDSNIPCDTYTKKAEYVPDNAVAAMHPGGGKARVNEAYGDHHDPEWSEDAPEGPYDNNFDGEFDKAVGNMGEENHFPEENPDLGAEEYGELGDPIDGIDSSDLEGGLELPGDGLEDDDFLAQFNDDPDEEIGEPIAPESDEKAIETLGDDSEDEIAGIDDMSGVDRNNLSADVIDDVVNEIVDKFSKGKKMNMISESVARTILREYDQDYAIMGADGNLEYHHPQNITVKEAVDYIGSYEPDEDGFTLFDFAGDSIEEEVMKVAREDGTVDFYDMQDLLDSFTREYHDNASGIDESRKNRKKMNMISESVASRIINEMFDEKDSEKKDREYYHDDDFMYGVPERQTADSDFKSPSPLSQYMDKGSRKPNVGKNGTLDPRRGAPSYVNPDQVDYDPDSEFYLQNKYELGLNDDPEADYTESGAWKATDEKARKYATARVAKAQKELEMIGSDLNIDTEKAVDIFRHALYTLQNAKNNLAIITGVHPEMIERFLSGNNIPYRNVMGDDGEGNLYGYRDAKDTIECIITPDGELPKDSEMEDEDQYVIGPSLKAMGFPDMSTEELRELVDDLMSWDDNYGAMLEEEENTMRGAIKYIQGLGYDEDAQYARTLNNVVTEWVSLLEDIAGLQSFAALPMEVLNKREEAANMGRARRGKNIRGGYEDVDASSIFGGRRSLREDTTVLHDFGNHPGYRKKPMTTPANTEVSLNGSRDWNDDSTKGEEPFGKKIGSGDPYDEIVDAVLRKVLGALNQGGQN